MLLVPFLYQQQAIEKWSMYSSSSASSLLEKRKDDLNISACRICMSASLQARAEKKDPMMKYGLCPKN